MKNPQYERAAFERQFSLIPLVELFGLAAFVIGAAIPFAAWGLVHDWVRHGLAHPTFALCGTLIVLSWPLRMWVAQSTSWKPTGKWVANLGG